MTYIPNPLDEYKDSETKMRALISDVHADKYAIDSNGKKYPLDKCNIKGLAFCGGLWRIQNVFPHKITTVRDQDMVLMKRLDRQESTLFEYWYAKLVGYNCYGPFINPGPQHDYIVAKYETDDSVLYGYGTTLESARAYLGLKLYDKYKDMIHKIECKQKLK